MTGQKIPEEIANPPELCPSLVFFLEAFFELSTCRQIGMGGEGPIPYTAIAIYAERHGFDPEFEDNFLFHIRTLDNGYMEFRAKEAAKYEKATKSRRTSGRP